MADDGLSAPFNSTGIAPTISETTIFGQGRRPKQVIHEAFRTAVRESEQRGASVIVPAIIGKTVIYVGPNSNRRKLLSAFNKSGGFAAHIGPSVEELSFSDTVSAGKPRSLHGRVRRNAEKGMTREKQRARDDALIQRFRQFWA